MPYELLKESEKKQLGKNYEAKMTIYNALPGKKYERVFMCKTAKEIWRTLIITYQGNSQVKNYKTDLLTQEYEKFSISSEETIDSGFTRFNAIMTSVKSLDPDYSRKNHMRKFLRALPLRWRAKVTAIKEAKYLATLPLDELIGNLKVYEMVLDNDGVASKTTKEKVKSLALKAKVTRNQTSDDSDSQRGSDEDVDEEEETEAFNLLARKFRKFFRKGGESSNPKGACYNCGIEGHFGTECRKPKENKIFVGGAWSDSEDGDEQLNDATCLMATDSQEVCLKYDLLPDNWIVNSGCTKHMTRNRRLFTLYKAYDGGHVVFGSNLKGKVTGGGQLCDDNCLASFTKVDFAISKNGKTLAKDLRRNGLYTYKLGDNSKQQICLSSVVDNSMLWHRRLGHANMSLGSQGNANNRTRKGVSTIRVLELLHLDLFGPSSIQSYKGYSQTSKAYIVLNKETMRIEESLNGLLMADSHTGNHLKDDFTPLKTIQRSHGGIGKGGLRAEKEEMAFRNFVYAKDEEDLSFLPKEPSPGFGTGSPSVSVNIKPLRADEELVLQPAEIKDRKCKTRGGSSRPPIKRNLASRSLNSRATRAKTSTSKNDVLFLTLSDDDKGRLLSFELFSIVFTASEVHPAVVDNVVSMRSRELLEVIEKLRGECDVIKERERTQEEESESLCVKCEAAMSDIEKNPTVIALWEKISTLSS
ncbi:retrovirus-related pol polyprotein from transposon TNT 1-94 [Tanacetum coccineum]